MERRQVNYPPTTNFETRYKAWRKVLTALEPESESALLQIASDATRASDPIAYLDTYARDLARRLQGLYDSSDEEWENTTNATGPFPNTTQNITNYTGSFSHTTQNRDDSSSEESTSNYTGLFSNTTLSKEDQDYIMESGEDRALRAELEKKRKALVTPFNDATGSSGGKTFTFGGNSRGYSQSSAKRHIETYVAVHGFPPGTNSMADLRASLFQAASVLVNNNTLGSKGHGTKATYQVNNGLSWNLIIEKRGNEYSIEHADINDMY